MHYETPCICTSCKILPEDDLRKIEARRGFDRLYVKIYIILTDSGFVGITHKGKGKGKVHPTTCHECPEGSKGIALLFL